MKNPASLVYSFSEKWRVMLFERGMSVIPNELAKEGTPAGLRAAVVDTFKAFFPVV